MAISAAGALASGLVFRRHTWRVLMLGVCLAAFEVMLFWASERLRYSVLEYRAVFTTARKIICVVSGVLLIWLSFKIRKTED